jgi:hypothetical protein
MTPDDGTIVGKPSQPIASASQNHRISTCPLPPVNGEEWVLRAGCWGLPSEYARFEQNVHRDRCSGRCGWDRCPRRASAGDFGAAVSESSNGEAAGVLFAIPSVSESPADVRVDNKRGRRDITPSAL